MLLQPVGTQVTISNDHVQDVDALAKRLVLIRERTEVWAPLLLEQLHSLISSLRRSAPVGSAQ
jgi:hypothetical protein